MSCLHGFTFDELNAVLPGIELQSRGLICFDTFAKDVADVQ
jgi:hypothetical protein